jgi:hypothetical protein
MQDTGRWSPRGSQHRQGARLTRGRFEAEFGDSDAARAAARDARAVGFVVEAPRETAQGWLLVGRRKLPFSNDDRDRYASRVRTIATHHHGALSRVVHEPLRREDY